jgi:integrase
MPAKANAQARRPSRLNRQVMPTRPPNSDLRDREYLEPDEIEQLIKAAKSNRWGHRDATLILTAFRHGLRAVEACDLEWAQVKFDAGTMHVRRVKNGEPAKHPIRGDELRMLRQLQREQVPKSPFVFTTERGTPFTTDAINRLVKMLGQKAKLAFPIHFHMLRHSCGYALANDGADTRVIQDYLGHRSIEHTVRYTKLNAAKFDKLWR